MRYPRTLTARILFGFSLLVLVFGIISGWTVYRLDKLNRAIRIVRVGFLELALVSRELADRQEALRTYLREDIENDQSVARIRSQINMLRNAREKKLIESEESLETFRRSDEGAERKYLIVAEGTLKKIRRKVDETNIHYNHLLKAPKLGRTNPSLPQTAPADQVIEAKSAYKILLRNEKLVQTESIELRDRMKKKVKSTMEELEDMSRNLRLFIFLSGVMAVLLGILVTSASIVMLRSLQRLRDRATRIAEGDYETRLEEQGPKEIQDIAREFNLMAGAIEEREMKLVRTERLATVGKMAAMITHEVRNPLSSIGLNTELLEDELSELDRAAEAKELVRSIIAEVDRLTDITEEYLRFARLPEPKLVPESMARIIRDVVGFERDLLKQHGVSVVLNIEDSMKPIPVDEAQVRQVIINLLRNSADAMETRGGVITMGLREESSHIVMIIEDDGPGVPVDVLENIFDPFVSSKEHGTGLGLALSQQIVQEHGGWIEASNMTGGGARFEVSFPRNKEVSGENA